MKKNNIKIGIILAGVVIATNTQITTLSHALEPNKVQAKLEKNIEENVTHISDYTKSEVVAVTNEQELIRALEDPNVKIVDIRNDIATIGNDYSGYDIDIKGNGKEIKGNGYTVSTHKLSSNWFTIHTDTKIDNLKLDQGQIFSGVEGKNLDINNSELNNFTLLFDGNVSLENIKTNNTSIGGECNLVINSSELVNSSILVNDNGGKDKIVNIINTEINGGRYSEPISLDGGSIELENVKITNPGDHAIYAEGGKELGGKIRVKGTLEIDGAKKDAIVLKKGNKSSTVNPLELYIDGDIKQKGDTYTVKAEEEGTYTKVYYDENKVKKVIEKWSHVYYSTQNREGNEPESIVYFNDIKDHWAQDTIELFVNKGYIDGYGDNSFRPDNSMTRAEFVKIVNKVFGFKNSELESFKDVNETDWYYSDICIAVKAGYIKGKSSDLFTPNDKITRQEVAMILTNITNNKDINLDKLNGFKDGNDTDDWARSSVEGAIEAGYIGGYDDKTIKPKGNITRSEAVSMLSRVKK